MRVVVSRHTCDKQREGKGKVDSDSRGTWCGEKSSQVRLQTKKIIVHVEQTN